MSNGTCVVSGWKVWGAYGSHAEWGESVDSPWTGQQTVHTLWLCDELEYVCVCVCVCVCADLPTGLYLTMLVRKSVGSTDVHPYFWKCGHRVSRKYGNHDVNEYEFVASEADHRALMGSYHSLTFAFSNHFQGWNIRPVLIGQKSLINQWTLTLHWNFMKVSHLPIWRVWIWSCQW